MHALLALLAAAPGVVAPSAAWQEAGALVLDLPFTMVNGRVYVAGKAGDRDLEFVVDTGAGASILDLGVANSLGIASDGTLRAQGVGGGAQGKRLKDFSIALGEITAPMRFALPLEGLWISEGRPMEAILGTDFLARFVVEFDYPASRFRLYPPGKGRPISRGVPFKLQSSVPVMEMDVEIGGNRPQSVTAMLDTGATETLTATHRFLGRAGLLERLAGRPTQPVVGGVGGFARGLSLRFASATLGTTRLGPFWGRGVLSKEGLLGEKAEYDVLLGARLLERFRLTLDYGRGLVFFEPGVGAAQPFVADRSGLGWQTLKDSYRRFVVATVAPGSGAEAAGIQRGDELFSVDGRSATEFTLDRLRSIFRDPRARGWRLDLNRGGEPIQVNLKAFDPVDPLAPVRGTR